MGNGCGTAAKSSENQIQNKQKNKKNIHETLSGRNDLMNTLQTDIIVNEEPRAFQYAQNQAPKIPCSMHLQKNVKLININPQAERMFYCHECALEQNYQNKFIGFSDIYGGSQDHFIERFSTLLDFKEKEFYNYLITKQQDKQFFANSKQLIKSYQANINKMIDDQLNLIDDCENQMNAFKLNKQTTSLQNQFKDCIDSNKNNIKDLESKIHQLVKEQIAQRENISDELSKCKEILSSCYKIISEFPSNLQNQSAQLFTVSDQISQNLSVNLKQLNQFIFEQLNLSESNLTHKVDQSLQIDQRNGQIVLKNNSVSKSTFFLKKNLMCSQFGKYELIFDYQKNSSSNQIEIGLFNRMISDNPPASVSFNQNSSNNIEVIKGIPISSDQETKREFTIQIDLKEKIFRFKFGENVNQIKVWEEFDLNSPKIQFGVSLPLYTTATIKSFKRVLQFDNL